MAILPAPGQSVRVGATTDWTGILKTAAIALAFLGSVAYGLWGHPSVEQLNFCETIAVSTGATLGVLRLSDLAATFLNVRAVLGSPAAQAAGVLAQAPGTSLVQTQPSTPVAPINGTNGVANGT